MSECKSNNKKMTPNQSGSNVSNLDLSSMSNILETLLCVFNKAKTPARSLPPQLLLIGKNFRPGMSARNLAGRIISKLESESNIPMGDVFADGQNSEASKMKVVSEELVNMLQTEAKVDVAIDPGAIQVTSTGSAGPVPVITQGSNTLFVTGAGGVR
jgi:hypothetical protein